MHKPYPADHYLPTKEPMASTIYYYMAEVEMVKRILPLGLQKPREMHRWRNGVNGRHAAFYYSESCGYETKST